MKGLGDGRLLAAYALVISLAACGFKPVYGTGSEIGLTLSDIEVAAPHNRESYFFVQSLETRLGRSPTASLLLTYNISLSERGLDLRDSNRSHVIGNLSYQLTQKGDGQVRASGSVESFTAYSVPDNLHVALRDDAIERLMSILADKVISDLSAKIEN